MNAEGYCPVLAKLAVSEFSEALLAIIWMLGRLVVQAVPQRYGSRVSAGKPGHPTTVVHPPASVNLERQRVQSLPGCREATRYSPEIVRHGRAYHYRN